MSFRPLRGATGGTGATGATGAAGQSRVDYRNVGFGALAENISRLGAFSTLLCVSGDFVAWAIGLLAGDVANGAALEVNSGGVGLTLAKVALYDHAGVRRAASADNSAGFAGTGLIQTAFAATYTVPASGLFYLGYLFVGATPPTVDVATGSDTNPLALHQFTGKPQQGIYRGAQADLPASLTPLTDNSPTIFPWLAAY